MNKTVPGREVVSRWGKSGAGDTEEAQRTLVSVCNASGTVLVLNPEPGISHLFTKQARGAGTLPHFPTEERKAQTGYETWLRPRSR